MESNFAALMERTFAFVVELFTKYGYWLIGIVLAVVVIMLPINYLVKTAFKNTENVSLQRIRKSISTVAVYIVSIGVLFLFQWLVGLPDTETILVSEAIPEILAEDGVTVVQEAVPAVYETVDVIVHNYNFVEVAQDTFRIGTLAMVVWWFIKLGVQVGFGPVITKIAASNEFKTALKEIGLDSKTANTVLDAMKVATKDKAAEANQKLSDYIQKNEAAINTEFRLMLNLYNIDKTKITEYANLLTGIFKKKHA